MFKMNGRRIAAAVLGGLMAITALAAYPSPAAIESGAAAVTAQSAENEALPQQFPAAGAAVISEGAFDDGTVDGVIIPGAEWRIYNNGTLVVGSGFIEGDSRINPWDSLISPWHSYSQDILKINFTGPITAGPSLSGLFSPIRTCNRYRGAELLQHG